LAPTTRDAILDGALEVMRTRGLAHATTKEIARAAGFSEATLYKLFADKTDLFICVLAERLPVVGVVSRDLTSLVRKGTVAANLTMMVAEIESFYEASLPIVMSLFSDVDLLARHREAVRARGAGPEIIVRRVTEYLRAEQAAGRVSSAASANGAAAALVGACMQRAVLRCFDNLGSNQHVGSDLAAFANDVVAAIMHGLSTRPLRPVADY